MRLIDHPLGAAEHRKVEEPRAARHKGGAVAGLFMPAGAGRDSPGQLSRRRISNRDLVPIGNRLEARFGLGDDPIGILDEAVDELARHRHAEAVARIGEEVTRVGTRVEALDMGAKAAREAAGKLDRTVAGTAAACRGQNRFDCHDALLTPFKVHYSSLYVMSAASIL